MKKSDVFLLIATIIVIVAVKVHTNYNIETPQEVEYALDIEFECKEVNTIWNNGYMFIKRYAKPTEVQYEVKGDIGDINILSTELYLLWYEYGYDPKITILVVDNNNTEKINFVSENGKVLEISQ